ncbi:MAG: IS1595 family transposase [Pseudomonadota bacterium]
MTTKPLTTAAFFRMFPDDETCLNHLFEVRFGQGHACPKCERDSKWHRIKAERAYSCQWCGHHLHPTVGTPFEKTRTPLQLWFYAIHLFTTTRHGVSAKELERQLGVTYKTAWRMAKLIREHMADVDGDTPIGGPFKTVEIDETFVGGHRRNGQGGKGKTVVFGMLEKGGDVVTEVVTDRKSGTLLPHVVKHVQAHSEVHTDEHRAYGGLSTIKGYWHKQVNHSEGQYVSGTGTTVNAIESFWSHLKRSIQGTHTSVSPKYLGTYTKEFEYRFNRRNRPETMLPELLSTFRPSPQQFD